MDKNLDDLKVVIMENWTYEPPHSHTLYYSAWGYKYDELMEPAKEVANQLIELLNESEDTEEEEELRLVLSELKPTVQSIRDFSFSTGWLGCECDCIAEGKNIAQEVTEFLDNSFPFVFFDEDDEEEPDEYDDYREIARKAKKNPTDYDTVIDLLEMLSDFFESDYFYEY